MRALLFSFLILYFPFVAAADGQSYALVVAGDGTDANFVENYKDWAVRLHKVLTGDCGIPAANVRVLMEKKELAPQVAADVSTKENVIKEFDGFAAKVKAGDQVIVVYIGHGTQQNNVGKLCLPGPDISSDETAELLNKLKTTEVIFINSSPCSDAFLEKCSKPGRVVITATNTNAEGNETYFMEFFLKAYEERDKAKTPSLSILDAFNSAATNCPKWYLRQYWADAEHGWRTEGKQSRALWQKFYGKVADKKEAPPENADAADGEPQLGEWGPQWEGRRMPTEHAQIDDNGDKLGTAAFNNSEFTPVTGSEEGADGWYARKIVVGKPGGAKDLKIVEPKKAEDK
jgi:hypothetical protein